MAANKTKEKKTKKSEAIMTILKNNKRKKIKTEVQEKSYFIKSIKIYTI